MLNNLNIVGASTRAAAMSALAAGYNVWCADRFADVDLQAVAPAELCDPYPAALPAILSKAPSGAWIYTGALENRPELLEVMSSRRHPLAGNSAAVVRAVRDPPLLSGTLRAAHLPSPEVAISPEILSLDGSWLFKPRNSAGGFGVRVWDAATATLETENASQKSSNTSKHYWQRRIAGQPISGVFVAATRRAVLLGSTRQLIGESWCWGLEVSKTSSQSDESLALPPFAYCGSLGPLHLPDEQTDQLQQIGETLAREFGLVGLFGVDAILTPAGEIFAVEVNPRYTASIEVLERASLLGLRGTRGKRLLTIALHLEACLEEKLPDLVIPVPNACVGKAILYVPRDPANQPSPTPWRFPTAVAQWAAVRNLTGTRPMVADIPVAESLLSPGQPLLTLLAEGSDQEEVQSELLVQAAECHELLREWQ